MRIRSIGVGLALLLQGSVGSLETDPMTAPACVETAPMPIARLPVDDPMPRHVPSGAHLAPMPIAVLVPCYLANGSRPDAHHRSPSFFRLP